MSKVPTVPWFRADRGTAGSDGCGKRPTPPPKHLHDVHFLPDEPLACADLVALAPLPVVIAAAIARR